MNATQLECRSSPKSCCSRWRAWWRWSTSSSPTRGAASPTGSRRRASSSWRRCTCGCCSDSSAYGMQDMVVSDTMGHALAFFATRGDDLHGGLRAAVRGVARHAQGRVLHAGDVRAARHLGDDRGQQLPDGLPGPGADEPVAVCADRAAPRPCGGHRGGDEVLRARCAGQRLPALRPVDDVRRHRHARRSPMPSPPSTAAASTRRC